MYILMSMGISGNALLHTCNLVVVQHVLHVTYLLTTCITIQAFTLIF